MDNEKASINIPVIIPAYEPDKNLLVLCEKLLEAGLIYVIIVDDGSGKEYREIFDTIQQKYNYIILRHAVNLGKGRALKEAFNYALNVNPNLVGVVTADSDGQHTPEDIIKCMEALIENPENLILGCRTFDNRDIPWKSKIGNELTKKVCSYLCGIKISDTQTGLRGIPSSFMKKLLSVSGERFEYETNMLIEALHEKTPLKEIPIQTVYVDDNRETHFRPIADSAAIYGQIFANFLKYTLASLSSFLLDYGIYSLLILLTAFLPIGPKIWLAAASARILSSLYNYTVNKNVVFKSNIRQKNTLEKYFLLCAVQLGCSACLVWFLCLHTILTEIPAKLMVDTFLFLISYHIQKNWVFQEQIQEDRLVCAKEFRKG